MSFTDHLPLTSFLLRRLRRDRNHTTSLSFPEAANDDGADGDIRGSDGSRRPGVIWRIAASVAGTFTGWRDATGRSTRFDCLSWMLFLAPVLFVLLVMAQAGHEALALAIGVQPYLIQTALVVAIMVPAALLTIALAVRRLNDIGLSRWFILPRICLPGIVTGLATDPMVGVIVSWMTIAFDAMLFLWPGRQPQETSIQGSGRSI